MSEPPPTPWLQPSEVFAKLVAPLAEKLDRTVGWDRLPPRLAMMALLGLRHRLRERNLYDTGPIAPELAAPGTPDGSSGQASTARTLDGSGNDPHDPTMGAARTRFGRNAPPVVEDEASLQRPSASDVSRQLLTREEFFPAEGLNLLAAAWLQFEVHDWFIHQTDPGESATAESSQPLPLKTEAVGGRSYPAFVSDQTHWWDASQLYGASEDFANAMRDGDSGRVKVDDELLAVLEQFVGTSRNGSADGGGASTSAAVPNLWVGTALFHLLFAKEHNAICDQLREEYPGWSGDRLYDKARLINAAVMAKIHTVEWTPAIIAHPATQHGLRASWWGLLGAYGRLFPHDEVLNGLPGSRLSHDGAPYALTEEFVTVYRMHPLIPDDVTFHRVSDGAEMVEREFAHLAVARDKPEQPRVLLEEIGAENAFYSLAIAHPGELTLHNYPRFLQRFQPVDGGGTLDLGAVDIHRTRETGVPRYNNFRRLFRLEPATSFQELANGNPKWARELRDVYDNRLEDVDLLIGVFAERKPKGFAFSDTVFRVFLLMAARRLRSDRFFTTDYTPKVYTPLGLEWIENATLTGILNRHYPELAAVLPSENPFQPWPRAGNRR